MTTLKPWIKVVEPHVDVMQGTSTQSDYAVDLSQVVNGKMIEGEENFVGDSEIIALGGASNETKDRPLG